MNETILKNCIMCESDKVKLTYLENRRYRVECFECGQYLEFNAPSMKAAEIIRNQVIRNNHKEDERCD